MKRALPAMFSKVDTLARLVVRSLPTPLGKESGTNWGRRLQLTDGSGWPCRSRHRISWRSRRSLPQNVLLSEVIGRLPGLCVYQPRRSWLRPCGRPEFRLRLTNHAIAAQPASNDALARPVSVPEPRPARSGASHRPDIQAAPSTNEVIANDSNTAVTPPITAAAGPGHGHPPLLRLPAAAGPGHGHGRVGRPLRGRGGRGGMGHRQCLGWDRARGTVSTALRSLHRRQGAAPF